MHLSQQMREARFFIPRAGVVNIRQIDAEHGEVVEALETVRRHIEEGGYENVRRTREVCTLLAEHFKSEERLMGRMGYPLLPQHIVHHDQCLGQVYRILGNAERACEIEIESLRDIYRVLIDDIFSADIAFQSFLLAQGFGDPSE